MSGLQYKSVYRHERYLAASWPNKGDLVEASALGIALTQDSSSSWGKFLRLSFFLLSANEYQANLYAY
jgi:hypothetical protein